MRAIRSGSTYFRAVFFAVALTNPAYGQERCSEGDREAWQDPACDAYYTHDNNGNYDPPSSFGALAYSTKTQRWYSASGWSSASKASSDALRYCRSDRWLGCKVMTTYRDGCVAVARAVRDARPLPGNDSFATAPGLKEAEGTAVKNCRMDWEAGACEIVLSQCSAR